MNILCNSKKLLSLVANMQRIISDRSSISALNGILLSAEGKTLHLTAYSLGLSIKTSLELLKETSGKILLNAKIFGDILKKISSEEIQISDDDNIIKITSGTANFSIAGLDPYEFPKLPSINSDSTLKLPADLLKNMIRQTIFCVSDSQYVPLYTGALFEITGDILQIVAIDGFKLAIRKEKINPADVSNQSFSFIVPEKALKEILNITSVEEAEDVNITVDKKHALFKINNYTIISQLLEGQFMNYKETIPTEYSTLLKVKTKDFIDTLDRVSLVVTEKSKNSIKCIIKNNSIRLSCMTSIGKAYDTLKAEVEGDEIEIGFNSRYMLEALKNTETDEIKISLSNNLHPIKIIPLEGDSFVFLILPVMIDNSQN